MRNPHRGCCVAEVMGSRNDGAEAGFLEACGAGVHASGSWGACEARLALAEVEIKAGSTLGLKQASLLTSDAHAHGLELVATKAQQLQKRP